MSRQFLAAGLASVGGIALAACGATPTATPVPATATKPPAPAAATATTAPVAPTATKAPAAPTAVPPTAAVKRGGTITVAINEDISSPDPNRYTQGGDGQIMPLIAECLVGGDAKDQVQPVLAEKWSTADGGKTWIFTLRQGVKFHNGREMTSDDVKYSFDRVVDEKAALPLGGTLRNMGLRTTAVDKYTVKFELTKGFGSFLASQLSNVRTVVIAKECVKADGTVDKPIGTGPWVYDSWQKGTEIRLKRFDSYWQKGADGKSLPYLDAVVAKVVPDDTVRLSALRAKDVDLTPYVPFDDFKLWASGKPVAGVNFKKLVVNSSYYFGLNPRRAPFQDPLVRQAVKYAVDRNEINEAVFGGLGEVHNQPFRLSSFWYQQDVPYPQPDLNKAKDLMKQAGLASGVDAVYSCWNTHQKYGEVIQAQLARIGIRVKLEVAEYAAWWARGPKFDWDITMAPIGAIWHPERGFCTTESTYNAFWLSGGNIDPEIDGYMLEGRNEVDMVKAKAIYKKLVQKVEANGTPIYMVNPAVAQAFRDYVKGYDPIDGSMASLPQQNGLAFTWLDK